MVIDASIPFEKKDTQVFVDQKVANLELLRGSESSRWMWSSFITFFFPFYFLVKNTNYSQVSVPVSNRHQENLG